MGAAEDAHAERLQQIEDKKARLRARKEDSEWFNHGIDCPTKSFTSAKHGLFIACDPCCATHGSIDLILISHEHQDHFNSSMLVGTLREIAGGLTPCLLPKLMLDLLRRPGVATAWGVPALVDGGAWHAALRKMIGVEAGVEYDLATLTADPKFAGLSLHSVPTLHTLCSAAFLVVDRSSAAEGKYGGGALFFGDMSSDPSVSVEVGTLVGKLRCEGKLKPALLSVSMDATATAAAKSSRVRRVDRASATVEAVNGAVQAFENAAFRHAGGTRIYINTVAAGMKHLVARQLAERLHSKVYVTPEFQPVYAAYKALKFEGFDGEDGELYTFQQPEEAAVHLVPHKMFDTDDNFLATVDSIQQNEEFVHNIICVQTSSFRRTPHDIEFSRPRLNQPNFTAKLQRTKFSDHSHSAGLKQMRDVLLGHGVVEENIFYHSTNNANQSEVKEAVARAVA